MMERAVVSARNNERRRAVLREIYRKRLIKALGRVRAWSCRRKRKFTLKEEELRMRKRRIKFAADTSLALASDGSAWSHALLSRLATPSKNKALLQRIVGKKRMMQIGTLVLQTHGNDQKNPRKGSVKEQSRIAEDVVNLKTLQLKRLIPGGKSMSNSSLFKEAADYILSLKTQVEVMSSLAFHSSSLRL